MPTIIYPIIVCERTSYFLSLTFFSFFRGRPLTQLIIPEKKKVPDAQIRE